jgi:serine/threonine protein phosphatase 1
MRPKPPMPPGTVVYAVGDVHGCLAELRELEGFVREDAARRDASRRVIVYLGDYVDRGPDSAGVVRHLLERPPPGFEAVHLMGNHERMMLDFLADPADGAGWLANGGVATLASYGIAFDRWAPRYAESLGAAAAALARALPPAERRFLETLRLTHREGGALFVHAGIRPGVALADQDEEDLLSIRGEFLNSDADHGAVVVHGHTPTEAPEFRRNRVGIDTGACYGRALTALGMDSAGLRVLQARA